MPTDHEGDISAFCASLEMLNTPYTCEEVSTARRATSVQLSRVWYVLASTVVLTLNIAGRILRMKSPLYDAPVHCNMSSLL